jgi:ABC-type Na+ efflux pump permease subunit
MIALGSHEEVRTDCGRWRDCKKIPATKPGFFSINGSALQLGSAALALVLVFFVLALAALLLLILLVLLTGLAALLAGLTGLTALSTLLSVLIHIICHENSPPFKCASRRII